MNYFPSNLLSGSPPPPPSLRQSEVYTVSVWFGMAGGRGVLSSVGDHILQGFNTLYLTNKIARPPQTKTFEGRGPQLDKHLPQSPFTGKFI